MLCDCFHRSLNPTEGKLKYTLLVCVTGIEAIATSQKRKISLFSNFFSGNFMLGNRLLYADFCWKFSRPKTIESDHYLFRQKAGIDTVRAMEDFTGIKFKLPKIDHVAIPDFAAGAMENWGLITYRWVISSRCDYHLDHSCLFLKQKNIFYNRDDKNNSSFKNLAMYCTTTDYHIY